MSSLPNSESALEKFVEKIDFTKLEGNPEDFYKTGLAFVENGQFDDGIIEFVKTIKTVSHQDSLFVNAVKELKSMGFSDTDIHVISGISKSESEVNLPDTDPIQKSTQDALSTHKIVSTVYVLLTSLILIINCWGLMFGLAVVGWQAIIGLVLMPILIIGGCIYGSKYFINQGNTRLGYIILFSAPILAWLYLVKDTW